MRLGSNVTAISDAHEAEDVIRSQPIQVAIVGLGLPNISGMELIGLLHCAPGPPEVIVLSGYTDSRSMAQAKQLGARAYLGKPCTPGEIEAAIATRVDTFPMPLVGAAR